jgi:hypothetical protein
MLRPHCQWHCLSRVTKNRLSQELGANVRPTLGPTGTPCGDRVWGIRCLIKSTTDKLLYGIGQGSCSSPIVWALLNQLLLTALGEEFDCILLVSVDGRTTDTHPGDSFVDDTTTGATDDNHYIDPISSTVRGLTQEEDSLVARMEVIIQFFLDLLQVTGGDLAPEKCEWYLIGHRWNKGVSKLIQIEPQHRSITMTSRSSGNVSGIKLKSPTEGHRTLGFFMTGDGTSNKHKRVMNKK